MRSARNFSTSSLASILSLRWRARYASLKPLAMAAAVSGAIDRRDVVGGPAKSRVLAEIERLSAELGQ